jgi:hypothetical protein
MFGMLFVLSNPDLRDAIFDGFERFYAQLSRWWRDLEFSVWEVAFWIAVTWIAVGMLRPVFMQKLRQVRMQQWKLLFKAPKTKATDSEPRESLWFRPWHNALIAVIVLFAVYLVFEFTTLWFKEFPEGFYYAGYAHEGAAWLTVALALATVVMSIIFRGEILRDPRIGRLRLLSWIWSAQNFLLAAAVYNRLLIYVGFNGMTFMRTIGFFGITTVVVGFFLVLWKIIYQRDFFWLLQRQLWALAAAGLIFALTPVDTIVYRYNTQRIMAGELAPSVQISVHPIDMGGILQILPLVECDNEIIREGVLAMLAERQMEAEQLVQKRRQRGWTTFQLRDRFALETLESYEPRWQVYRDRAKRDLALSKFHKYVYQWY